MDSVCRLKAKLRKGFLVSSSSYMKIRGAYKVSYWGANLTSIGEENSVRLIRFFTKGQIRAKLRNLNRDSYS